MCCHQLVLSKFVHVQFGIALNLSPVQSEALTIHYRHIVSNRISWYGNFWLTKSICPADLTQPGSTV